MKKMFPLMFNCPNKSQVFAILAYWLLIFIFFPALIRVISWVGFMNTDALSWVEIIYHVIILAGTLIICREYLQDSFLKVQLEPKMVLHAVILAAGLILLYAAGAMLYLNSLEPLPLHVSSINLDANVTVLVNPLFGTLCMSFVCPIATCCVFYATGFAPMCTRNPVLAYILGAFVASLPRLLGYLLLSMYPHVLPTILFQIPVHLICCWSYQKTDTIWAPIATQCVVNLIGSVFLCFGHSIGLIGLY